jgi:hypothetical protein
MIWCYLYIHVYESVNSLQRLWFVKVTNESALVLLPQHDQYVCLQKESYRVLSWWLFVSYEWYNSCHSKKSRLWCREGHCNTYIRYVFLFLFAYIYIYFENPFIKMRGLLSHICASTRSHMSWLFAFKNLR